MEKYRIWLEKAIEASIKAGLVIMEVYHQTEMNVEIKSDNSPVTIADKRASKVILEDLKETGLPIISEEETIADYEVRKHWEKYWLIDPLDGTKEFIRRNTDFTVNIALIENNAPVMGVIYCPVTGELYWGVNGNGAYKYELKDVALGNEYILKSGVRLPLANNNDKIGIVGSRSHMNEKTQQFIDNFIKEHGEEQTEFIIRGSSLKFCMLAEGKAHVYPRFSNIMEWDTAAGHAIAEASGCTVTLIDNETPLQYNKECLYNPFFIASRQI